jgi:pyrroline-5-carboxylate reductase
VKWAPTPAEIVREMIEYRGTTAVALAAMTAGGFHEAFRAWLAAAANKAAEIRERGS